MIFFKFTLKISDVKNTLNKRLINIVVGLESVACRWKPLHTSLTQLMRGRVDPAFASYTLPWANMGCICLSLEVNASHQTSLPVQHLPIRMESSYICVWGWHFNAHLFSHFFIWKKNFSLLLPFWHEEKLFYSQEKEKNVFISKQEYFSPFGSIDSV